MHALFDTNVALDWVLEREPWFTDASGLWQLLRAGRITGYISASAVTDIYYVVRRLSGVQAAHSAVHECLTAFTIVPVDRVALEAAASLPGSDFEDNLQIVCATNARLDAIVTRDQTGFRAASIPVVSPAEAQARLS